MVAQALRGAVENRVPALGANPGEGKATERHGKLCHVFWKRSG
jgi:hypothetical protein